MYEGQKIHEDDEMKPLVITDIFKISGDLTDSETKNQQLSFWYSGTGEDEQHTPIYWYKVKNNKIHFLKKDTTLMERMHQLNQQ